MNCTGYHYCVLRSLKRIPCEKKQHNLIMHNFLKTEHRRHKNWNLNVNDFDRYINNLVIKTTVKTVHVCFPRFHSGILSILEDAASKVCEDRKVIRKNAIEKIRKWWKAIMLLDKCYQERHYAILELRN